MSETKSYICKKFLPQNCITIFLMQKIDWLYEPYHGRLLSPALLTNHMLFFFLTNQVCYLFLLNRQQRWILKHSSYIHEDFWFFSNQRQTLQVITCSYNTSADWQLIWRGDLQEHCILMSQGRTNNFPIRRLEKSRLTELNYSSRNMYLIPLLKQTFPINIPRNKEKMGWVFHKNTYCTDRLHQC